MSDRENQNTPWYPPGEGWIEWAGGENPAPGAVVQCLYWHERDEKGFDESSFASENWEWAHQEGEEEYSIVAYRVVTPAPSPTIDRALFDEMVEALERAQVLMGLRTIRDVIQSGDRAIDAAGLNPWCINEGLATGDERIPTGWIDAVLAKAREASK